MMERSLTEQKAVNLWIQSLKSQCRTAHIPCTVWQIETGGTQIGVPDLFVMLGDVCCWIECKFTNGWTGHFRPGQKRALALLRQHKQHALVALIDKGMCVWYLKPEGDLDSSTIDAKGKFYDLPDILKGLQDFLQGDVL